MCDFYKYVNGNNIGALARRLRIVLIEAERKSTGGVCDVNDGRIPFR